ncbi:MAG TPA: response regulator [Gammaproteobacteria bacterium]|nr:response regulator [Gammaproteobacteria bacterium]
MESQIRILLSDHQSLVRQGIQRLLEDDPGFVVVGEAASGDETVDLAACLHPDVVLLDLNLPGIGSLEAIRRLRRACPSCGILAMTTEVSDPFPGRLLEVGASGYLTKHCDIEEIVKAIRAVAGGERYISADIAREMALSMLPGGEQSPFDRLSQREMQVMIMVTQGQSVHAISDKLCLSPKTVSTYRYRLYDKLGVDNDVELTHLALRHGILEPTPPRGDVPG